MIRTTEEWKRLIGSRLKVYRLQKGLSQLDVARAIDVTHEWIGRVERGEGHPVHKKFLEHCHVVDAKPEWVTAEGDTPIDVQIHKPIVIKIGENIADEKLERITMKLQKLQHKGLSVEVIFVDSNPPLPTPPENP